MENLEAIVQLIDSWLWGRWLVFVLLALGVLYTVSNGFIQIRHFGFIIRRTLIDSYKSRHEDKGNGSISTFKAMMVTLAGNVGGGNVVGVATAILSGGMGAVFWMWVAAFFGISVCYSMMSPHFTLKRIMRTNYARLVSRKKAGTAIPRSYSACL